MADRKNIDAPRHNWPDNAPRFELGINMRSQSLMLKHIVAAATVAIVTIIVLAPHMQRSAFYDEAWMIDAAYEPDATSSLAMIIDTKQPLAPGYLMAMRLAKPFDEGGTWPYRVPAMLATVVLIIAMGVALTPIAGRVELAYLAALTLLACPMVQRYGTEIKQYIVTAATAILLMVASAAWCAAPRGSKGAAWAWFIAAIIALLFTFGGWFMVAASGLVVGLVLIKQRAGEQVVRAIAMGAALLSLMAVLHLGFNRHISGSSVLTGYWKDYFTTFDANWPATMLHQLEGFLGVMWYRYSLPARVTLAIAGLGWIVWFIRHRRMASIAAVMMLAPMLANAAKLWPLGPRLNLHFAALLHFAILVLPLSVVSLWIARRRPLDEVDVTSSTPRSPVLATVLFIAMAAALGFGLQYESRGADFEVAELGNLQLKLSEMATDDHVVALTPAAANAQRLQPADIAGTIRAMPWPSDSSIRTNYFALVTMNREKRILFGIGHDQKSIAVLIERLGEMVAKYGKLNRTWSDRFVAIYEFTPRDPNEPSQLQVEP